MTATDELRRLLDERGVEWHSQDSASDYHDCIVFRTWWNGNCFYEELYHNGDSYTILDLRSIENITPEQAVETTLGRGECKWSYEQTDDGDEYDHKWVTYCGWEWDAEGSDELQANGRRYCPHCGGRIVKEDE